jgi:hypothetical protein
MLKYNSAVAGPAAEYSNIQGCQKSSRSSSTMPNDGRIGSGPGDDGATKYHTMAAGAANHKTATRAACNLDYTVDWLL